MIKLNIVSIRKVLNILKFYELCIKIIKKGLFISKYINTLYTSNIIVYNN